MLTESEKRWLIKRAKKWANFCDVCIVGNENCKLTHFRKKCPTNIQTKDLLDALEFESRVAAMLANIHFGTEDCQYCSNHINVNEYCGECKTASTDKRCLDCRMKSARLKVEEEMDAD